MKSPKTFSFLLLLTAVILGSCCMPRKAVKPSEQELSANYVKVQDVLNAIQYAIEKAYVTDPGYSAKPPKEDPENALNHLSEISVELSNSLSSKVGGEVSFWIVKASGSRGREKASTFTYTFVPIKDEGKVNTLLASEKDVTVMDARTKQLQAALVSLGTCLKKYKNPSYKLDKLELEVSFKVTTSASAGVGFEIGAVSIGPEGELEWGNEHVLTLSFELSSKESKPSQTNESSSN